MNPSPPPRVRRSFWRALALTLVVAALNVGLWAYLNRPVHIADWHGEIGGLAYNPSQRYQDPTKLDFPSEAELDSDIRLLSRYTKRLRTYSSEENPQIPRLAQFYGVRLMAGAWIEGRSERNERELERADCAQPQVRQHRPRDRRKRGDPARRPRRARADQLSRPCARAARHPGLDRRASRHLAASSGACRPRRLHHRAHPAVLGVHRPQGRGRIRAWPVPRTAEAVSGQAGRDRRGRLAVERRPPQVRAALARERGALPARLVQRGRGARTSTTT